MGHQLTLEEIENTIPPPKNAKMVNSPHEITLEELDEMIPPPKKGAPWYKQIGIGTEAGLAETEAGINRVANALGMPDWILKTAEANSEKQSKKVDQTSDNDIAEKTKAITGFLSALGATSPLAVLTPEVAGFAELPALAKVGGRALKSIVPSIGFSDVTASPDESLTESSVIGGLLGPAGSLAGDVVGSGIQSMTKFKKLLQISKESGASIEEIKQAIKSAKGTTPLAGAALKNPTLKKTEENMLPTLLGFQKKARAKLAEMGALLVNQANEIVKKLSLPLSKEQRSEAILDSLDKNADKLENENIKNYKKVNLLADSLKATIVPENFYKTAKELLKKYSQTLSLFGISASKKELTNLKSVLDSVKAISDYAGSKTQIGGDKAISDLRISLPEDQKDIVNKWIHEKEFMGYGKKQIKAQPEFIKNSPLDISNFTRSILGDLSYSEKLKGNRRAASIYKKLYNAITKDIDNGIKNTNSKELSDAYSYAQKFYKENIVPLMKGKTWGALTAKVDPDTIISSFFPVGSKSGKGRLTLLSKLMKNAPHSEKLLLSEVFSKSLQDNQMGEQYVNPAILRTTIGQIGNDRLNMLIKNPEDLEMVKDFLNNMENADSTLELMFNPKTGYATMANINFFESGKVAQKAISDTLKGKILDLLSSVASYGGKHAEARAINDSQILNKIINIKEGKDVPKGMYKIGEVAKASGVPLSRLLIEALNSSGDNNG